MKIFMVDEVQVMRQGGASPRLLIHAVGKAASTGWTHPKLTNDDPNPKDAVAEFAFEADRPDGMSLPVLTPITANLVVELKTPIDAVIVHSRTNEIVVHASTFSALAGEGTPGAEEASARLAQLGGLTTLALGEEGPPLTTLRVGEERSTTLRFGEEGGTTLRFGEEGGTTARFGEEGGTTLRFGEEGPWTDPRVDDPFDPSGGGGGPGPFGSF